MKLAIIFAVIVLSFTSPSLGQNVKKSVIVSDTISLSPFPMERYTPTAEDLSIAEKIIKNESKFKSQQPNLLYYRRYYKQYAGFYNDKGEKNSYHKLYYR